VTSKYILPTDRCRCHDNHCPQSAQCLRFLQRAISHDPLRVVATSTFLREGMDQCDYFIQAEEGDALPE